MSRPSSPPLEDQLDDALGSIVNSGWDDPETPTDIPVEAPAPRPASAEPDYPPLPVPSDEWGNPLPPEDDTEPTGRVLDIGLLTDLATGKKSAVAVAEAAGVDPEALQSQLAVALRQVPPEEIAKALGLQAAEQQLKSGALYGAVLSELVADMISGRMRPADKLELAKLLARVGRVEPKDEKNVGAGSGFILNINLGQGAQPVTLEAE